MWHLYFFLILFFVVSCSKKNDKLATVLNLAGDYKDELIKVLDYYQSDTLKLEAALFLIENMIGHSGYDPLIVKQIQPIYDEYETISEKYNWNRSLEWVKDVNALSDRNEDQIHVSKLKTIPDINVIKADWLIKEIDMVFKSWHENVYTRNIPFNDFCKYVLPYRFYDKFCIDNSRIDFYNQHKGIFGDSAKDLTKVIDSLHFQYCSIKHCGSAGLNIPICDIPTYKQIKRGLCEHQTVFNSRLMTALGMPVVIDFVPTWGNRSKGHSWNVLILNDKIYPFEPFWDDERWKYSKIYNNETFDLKAGKFRLPKVYRQTFEYHLADPMLDENENRINIPVLFLNPWMLDVSAQYFKTSDVSINVSNDIPYNVRYCYLCVFDAVSVTWTPVQWGKIENDKVVFKDMGRDIVYLPAFCINGNMVPAGPVFVLDKEGKCKPLKHSEEKQNITINALNPLSVRHGDKFIGACVIGCKNIADSFQQDTLYVVNDTIDACYNKVELHSKNKYRYIRLTIPQDTIALNEITFYEQSCEKQVQIKDIKILTGIRGVSKMEVCKIIDNLTGTGFRGVFNDKAEREKGILFDLGDFCEIGGFSFVPFAESSVNTDDYFTLYYWDNGWTAVKKIKGGENDITFIQVPSSALYLIKCSRPADSNYYAERIFTYEDGKIVWW